MPLVYNLCSLFFLLGNNPDFYGEYYACLILQGVVLEADFSYFPFLEYATKSEGGIYGLKVGWSPMPSPLLVFNQLNCCLLPY